MPKERVALMGLGTMGTGMANRLLAAGFPLTVYNRSPERAEPLAGAGAAVAGSAAEAAASADIVMSMVADDHASRELWLGGRPALAAVRPGSVLVESSTLTRAWVRELAMAAEARECVLVDAPVTGSRAQAAAGEINFLVGGPAAAIDRIRPVLMAMGRSVVHLGASGSGTLMKLINNFVCGVEVAALAEAIAMIEHDELDREKALAVLTDGAPGSPLLRTVAERMTLADYTPNFKLRLMAKDLTYAVEESARLSIPSTTAAAALEVFRRSLDSGRGDDDFAVLVEQFRH